MKNQKQQTVLVTQAKLLISNSIRSLFVLIFGILQVRKNTDLLLNSSIKMQQSLSLYMISLEETHLMR